MWLRPRERSRTKLVGHTRPRSHASEMLQGSVCVRAASYNDGVAPGDWKMAWHRSAIIKLRAQRVIAVTSLDSHIGQADDFTSSPFDHVLRHSPRFHTPGLDDTRKSLSTSVGSAPSCPADTCTFCSRTALTTSPAVRPRAATLFGSSQRRIA